LNIRQTNSTLIVGGDSTIGGILAEAYEVDSKPVWKTTRHRNKVNKRCLFLDLFDDLNSWHLPHELIRTAIFCAAVTSHEECRLNPELSWRVNVRSTVALATRMVEAGVFVVFLSSNAVFNGDSAHACSTDQPTAITEYGRQKAEAERQLIKLGDRVAIVRFSKVITPKMPLIKDWIRNLKTGNVIHPFLDMMISPVPVTFATSVLSEIALKQIPGIFQVSAKQDITYANLAGYIADKLNVNDELVQPISYRDVGFTDVARNTTLDSSGLTVLGLQPPDVFTGVDETFELN